MNVLEILAGAALLLWTAGGAYVVLTARKWDCVMEALMDAIEEVDRDEDCEDRGSAAVLVAGAGAAVGLQNLLLSHGRDG
mgnify:CR=1 FL=1